MTWTGAATSPASWTPATPIPAGWSNAAAAALGFADIPARGEALFLDIPAAAELIAYDGIELSTRFNSEGATNGNAVWRLGSAVFVGSCSGTVLTVTSVVSGTIAAGTNVTGTGVTANQKINALLTGRGGAGTYRLAKSQTLGSRTLNTGAVDYLAIESQRTHFDVVAGALIKGDAAQLNTGLLGAEFCYLPAVCGPLGNWPMERGGPTVSANRYNDIHPKSEAFEATVRTALLLRQSRSPLITSAIVTRVDALVASILVTGRWMASSINFADFFQNKHNLNQLFFCITGMYGAGVLGEDAALVAQMEPYLADLISRQVDGVFNEAGGFDPSYQTVSLDLLARIVLTQRRPWLRPDLVESLRLGVERWLRPVSADGTFTEGGTRTVVVSTTPGIGPKGHDIDTYARRVLYWDMILRQGLGGIADAIQRKGQSLDHQDD